MLIVLKIKATIGRTTIIESITVDDDDRYVDFFSNSESNYIVTVEYADIEDSSSSNTITLSLDTEDYDNLDNIFSYSTSDAIESYSFDEFGLGCGERVVDDEISRKDKVLRRIWNDAIKGDMKKIQLLAWLGCLD